MMIFNDLQIRDNLQETYGDIYTGEALSALSSIAHFNSEIEEVMAS